MPCWSVLLEGDRYDLELWLAELAKPFEPHVEKIELPPDGDETKEAYVLKSLRFATCANANEVREAAEPLLHYLNGLLVVWSPNRPQSIKFSTVVEHAEDGSVKERTYFATGTARAGARVRGVATGGTPAPPKPSFVQSALATADADQLNWLEHFGRAENWDDLYRAYEALGKKDGLKDLGFTNDEIKNFLVSAQRGRHHKFAGQSPKRWLSVEEGRAFMASAFKQLLS